MAKPEHSILTERDRTKATKSQKRHESCQGRRQERVIGLSRQVPGARLGVVATARPVQDALLHVHANVSHLSLKTTIVENPS